MKINKIIAILLVISMLFVQSTYIMAVETQEENIEAIYNDEENTSEEDALPNSIVDSNPDEILAQIKPTSGLYDEGDRIYQIDNFATHYFLI